MIKMTIRHGEEVQQRLHRGAAHDLLVVPDLLEDLLIGTLVGIGDGDDTLLSTVGAVLTLQQPLQATEGDGRLSGGAGFGDNSQGEVLALQ